MEACIAELQLLENSLDDGVLQGNVESCASLIRKSLDFVDRALSDTSMSDAQNTISAVRILRSAAVISYKQNILDEATLRSWKLLPKVLSFCSGEEECLSREFDDMCTTLIAYCADGLDTLAFSVDANVDELDSLLEQHASTIKLLGFFVQRLFDLLLRSTSEAPPVLLQDSLMTILRLYGTLVCIGRHRENYNSLTEKIAESLIFLISGSSAPKSAIEGILNDTLVNASVEMLMGMSQALILCFEPAIGALGVNEQCSTIVDMFLRALEAMVTKYTGAVEDRLVISLVQDMADHIAIVVANCSGASTLQDLMRNVLIANAVCSGSLGSLGRLLLVAVLAGFAEEDQLLLVQLTWSVLTHEGALTGFMEESAMNDVASTLRTVLMTVEAAPKQWLLRQMLTDCGLRGVAGADTLDGTITNSSPLPAAVVEAILQQLPIMHLISANDDVCEPLLQRLVDACIQAVMQSGGDAQHIVGTHTLMPVGYAVAILHATAGFHDHGNPEYDSTAARSLRSRITGNAALGTVLLRWLSSLSEHIKTLLAPTGNSVHRTTSVPLGRLTRAQMLLQSLLVLLRCFWSHTLPRGVQNIVGKAVQCCLEAAHACLSMLGSATSSSTAVRDETMKFAMLAGECAATAMKIVSASTVTEQTIEGLKSIFITWGRVVLQIQTLCSEMAFPAVATCTVTLLTALQQFANALPAAMKARARELVIPELVPVIHARAQGRTYSLRQQAEVALTAEDTCGVWVALQNAAAASDHPCTRQSVLGKRHRNARGASNDKNHPRKATRSGQVELLHPEQVLEALQRCGRTDCGTAVPVLQEADAAVENENLQVAVLLLSAKTAQALSAEGVDADGSPTGPEKIGVTAVPGARAHLQSLSDPRADSGDSCSGTFALAVTLRGIGATAPSEDGNGSAHTESQRMSTQG